MKIILGNMLEFQCSRVPSSSDSRFLRVNIHSPVHPTYYNVDLFNVVQVNC